MTLLKDLVKKYNIIAADAEEVKDDEADSALMTESDKFKKYGPIVKTFKSQSSPNKPPYQVRQLKGQDPTCNCRGWATHRKCRHVDEVKRLHLHPVAAKAGKSLLDRINGQGGKQMTKSDLASVLALAKKLASEMQKWAPDDWDILFKGNEIPE